MTHLLQTCLESVRNTSGIYAEFGVLHGDTFKDILNFAKLHDKKAYAFDSFRGMAEPTEKDGELGKKQYPIGRFDVGGPQLLITTLVDRGYNLNDFAIIEGFLPETLEQVKDLKYAFARVDLDHYYPTKCVLEYLLLRMSRDSIVLCDDYFIKDHLASQAYKEFLEEHSDVNIFSICGREMAWKLK